MIKCNSLSWRTHNFVCFLFYFSCVYINHYFLCNFLSENDNAFSRDLFSVKIALRGTSVCMDAYLFYDSFTMYLEYNTYIVSVSLYPCLLSILSYLGVTDLYCRMCFSVALALTSLLLPKVSLRCAITDDNQTMIFYHNFSFKTISRTTCHILTYTHISLFKPVLLRGLAANFSSLPSLFLLFYENQASKSS